MVKKYIFYGGTPCFHPTWFFRKALLKKVNGYRILPTSQDYDFLVRLFYLGIKVSNMEEPLLYHRIHFARISAEKNIYQLKLTRYIMMAAQKRFIMDDDKFSSEAINKVMKTPSILYLLHKLSLLLFKFSYNFRNSKKRVRGFLFYVVSTLVSPYRLQHTFRGIVRSFILIKTEVWKV